MTTIYLVRHAEAEGNISRRFHAHHNSLITHRGLQQIADLERRFEPIHIDAVYSSDLYRAQRTAAAAFVQKNLPLHIEPRLREVGGGVWEDVPFGDLKQRDPEMFNCMDSDPWMWNVKGSETIETVCARMTEAIREIAQRHNGQSVAVFSHGMAIRIFLCAMFESATPEGWEAIGHPANTCVSTLTVENGVFTARELTDASHLLPENITKRYSGPPRELRYEERGEGSYAVMLEDEECGRLDLDLKRDAADGIGYVTRYELFSEFRGLGCGVQLLGQATSVFRRLGRKKLHIALPGEFSASAGFFEKLGFSRTANGVELSIFVPDKFEAGSLAK